MRKGLTIGLIGLFLAGLLMTGLTVQGQQPATLKSQAPEFKEVGEWFNTKPLQMKDLKGKVVVVHFWAFG